MFESHVVKDFWGNLQLKIIIYCVTDQPTITQSRRLALNFKFSPSHFSEVDRLLAECQEKNV